MSFWTVPAKAAFGAVEPSQYVVNQIVDGDTKIIVYQFTGFQPYCIDTRNNTIYEQGIINGTKQVSTEGNVPISLNFYPFGNKFYLNQPIYTGSAIDVRDIIPGAELSLNFSFLTKFSQVTNLEGITVTYNATAACYDKDGKYLRRSFIEKEVSAIEVDLDKTIGMNLEMVIQSDVAYVAVYSTYSFKATVYDFVCNITPQPLQLSVPINMIYEDSVLMNAIKDKLSDIDNSLGDINDSIQEGNDKLDEIISGGDGAGALGDAGDDLVADSDNLSDKFDEVGSFQDDLIADFDTSWGQIDVKGGLSNFVPALTFTANYMQRIFDGIDYWSVVIILPCFLGIFLFICSHTGGLTYAVHPERRSRSPAPSRRGLSERDRLDMDAIREDYLIRHMED